MEIQKQMEQYIEEKREQMLALWEQLVNAESYVGEADNVNRGFRLPFGRRRQWLGRNPGRDVGSGTGRQAHSVFRPFGYRLSQR